MQILIWVWLISMLLLALAACGLELEDAECDIADSIADILKGSV